MKIFNFIVGVIFLVCACCLDSENYIPFFIGVIVCGLYLIAYGIHKEKEDRE